MKKIVLLLFAASFLFSGQTKADEGMWIPLLINQLNLEDMQEMGLELTAEQIFSINQNSLKDAIIIFGRGCTGSIISAEGLILTNHHCGYGSIQSVSTVENDYLKNGFWAASLQEEIPVDGLTVKFLIKMEDVTQKVLEEVSDEMSEEDRQKTIREKINALIKETTKDTHYDAVVESFFGGNNYYLFIYETFRDIRLVGTPPESIGKFGKDTDNWMWPRHTGDFSIFRVYSAPDGKPASYAAENQPIKAKHFLPISTEGIEKGNFAMILGYPGSTDRYRSSWGVDLAIDQNNMTIVDIRTEKLRIMDEGMKADEAVRLQYASKYARTSNYWKYFIGQTKGLKRLKVAEKKRAVEAEFTSWVQADASRQEKYGNVLSDMESAYEILKPYDLSYWYHREAVVRGPEILGFAQSYSKLLSLLEADQIDDAEIAAETEKNKARNTKYFKDYNATIDQNMLASMFRMYHENVPPDQQPMYMLKMDKKYKGDWASYAAMVFDKSVFSNQQKLNDFLNKPKAKTLEKDPAMIAMNAMAEKNTQLQAECAAAKSRLNRANRLFIAGLQEMYPGKKFYPDANFTMRLTYGTVKDYYPADAVHYDYLTTMKGIMQKEDSSSFEFFVQDRLKELYKERDFGIYDVDGEMPVCFLTTHDITGGNSGSPVINGKGELVGLAFDGNWEAMSGDIAYEPELQRTINVDIRFVLFIIDKYAQAQHIMEELKLVSSHEKTPVIGNINVDKAVKSMNADF